MVHEMLFELEREMVKLLVENYNDRGDIEGEAINFYKRVEHIDYKEEKSYNERILDFEDDHSKARKYDEKRLQ